LCKEDLNSSEIIALIWKLIGKLTGQIEKHMTGDDNGFTRAFPGRSQQGNKQMSAFWAEIVCSELSKRKQQAAKKACVGC
jgi:hypothetical protein